MEVSYEYQILLCIVYANMCMCTCVYVCVFVVWEGERKNRGVDREGECRVGRALVSFASRPPPRVCKA